MYKSEASGAGRISAKVVADSIGPGSIRLLTLELMYPRFIHSEFMTHRVFSRNASSSRAIPVDKMLAMVEESPAMPVHWGSNKPGMQAGDEIEDTDSAKLEWFSAAQDAVLAARELQRLGIHKQVTNRLIEPFQFIKVVVTGTEWDNFFILRNHEAAQPEIQQLARMMQMAIDGSTSDFLLPGEYHLPYVFEDNLPLDDKIKASVARCARVSYMNHDNTEPNIEKDAGLHDMLKNMGHMSPFEHIATPMKESYVPETPMEPGVTHVDRNSVLWSGNLRNWIQYRQLL